jgi:hypothetical protein
MVQGGTIGNVTETSIKRVSDSHQAMSMTHKSFFSDQTSQKESIRLAL